MPATIIQPLITNAGLAAAIAASGSGVQLAITHIQLGSSAYVLDPTPGSADYNRTALVTPTEKVAAAAGHVMDKGFRVDASFPSWTLTPYGVTEIGFWAGDPAAGGVLFAIWAQATPFTTRSNIDYLASFAVALARVPAGSVTVTYDPSLSDAMALVNFHEAEADPHTQYIKRAGDTMDNPLHLGAAAKPAQFDDSDKVPSTGWIRRFGRQFAGVNSYSVNTVLTGANDVGKLTVIAGGGATFTLPPSTSVPPGASVFLMMQGGTAIINAAGPDTIATGPTAVLSTTLSGNEYCELISNGINAWIVTDSPMLSQRTGDIALVLGIVPKTGTIKANGAVLSRTTYARLWAYAQGSGNIAASDANWLAAGAYGQFSPGDGATTFRVPDLRGYHLRMYDDGRGVDGGRLIGSIQADQLLAHAHTISDPGHGHTGSVGDPGHVHSTSVSDPGHVHGATVSDPTHNHSVNDPTHAHSITHYSNSDNSGSALAGATAANGSVASSNGAATGVTLNASATGVTVAIGSTPAGVAVGIGTAVAGITVGVSTNGSNVTINNSSGGAEVRVKNIAVMACIYY